jgi:hypothetical protein
MKKILLVLSVLSLLSYGCNRNEGTATDTGMQQEERRMDTTTQDLDTPSADIQGADSDFDVNEQREEVRPVDSEYREGDITTPVDDRPELEEDVVE